MNHRFLIALLAVAAAFWAGSSSAGGHSVLSADKPTVLITGSNRGIGLALTKEYSAKGWNVIATARKPEKADELNAFASANDGIVVEQLDVTDLERIDELAAEYEGVAIDVLFNNAAILGDLEEQAYGTLDHELFLAVMDINIYGPMYMAQAFTPHVLASDQKKFIAMTSGLGSNKLMGRMSGMNYYRISKAGLNMAWQGLRADLKPQGGVVALVAPGMVGTQLLADSGYRGKSLTPEQSAEALYVLVDGITIEDDREPRNFDGKPIPW